MSINTKNVRLRRAIEAFISGESQSETNSKSKLSCLKDTLISWSLTVDINCYSKAFEYKNNLLIQLVWFLILFLSTCATFWLISLSIIGYLKYDVVTQTNVIQPTYTKFPAITVCNNDPFTSVESQKLYEDVAKSNGFNFSNQVNNDLNLLVKVAASNPAFGDEKRKKLGFDKSIIIGKKA